MNNGAIVNIILAVVMKKLGRKDDELVTMDVIVTNFIEKSYKQKGILLVYLQVDL